jgi:hypothetical protein
MAVLTRSSQKSDVTGNITSNNNKEITASVHRGVLDNFIDSAKFRKDDLPIPAATTAGTGNDYTVAIANDYPGAYTANFLIFIKADRANTGDATININSLGVKSWLKFNGSEFASGDIKSGGYYFLFYNGTDFLTFQDQSQSESITESSSTSLSLLDGIYAFTGSSNATWTLPEGVTGSEVTVYNDCSNDSTVTIQTSGGQTMTANFGGVIYQGSFYTFKYVGTRWILI